MSATTTIRVFMGDESAAPRPVVARPGDRPLQTLLFRAMRVILASQSPRRRDLLNLIGIAHTVRPADIDETPLAW